MRYSAHAALLLVLLVSFANGLTPRLDQSSEVVSPSVVPDRIASQIPQAIDLWF